MLEKCRDLETRVRGHSRSSHRHLWFPVNVPQQPWTWQFRADSEINGDFGGKSHSFPTSWILRSRWRGSPWNWIPALGVKKLEWWGHRAEKEVWLSSALWIQSTNVTDGQTDGQTDTGRQQRPRLRIASRGKNYNLYKYLLLYYSCPRWIINSHCDCNCNWCLYNSSWVSVTAIFNYYDDNLQLVNSYILASAETVNRLWFKL